jgi:hypothetical protein
MANPLQGVTQLGVNEFWGLLQQLQSLGSHVKSDLSADRLQLMSLYNQARNDPDTARGGAAMKSLDPLVHNNSALRLKYQDLATKFNQAVNGASSLLKKAGLTTPTLSGLGIAPVVIIGVAVIALAAAFAIYETVRFGTDAQRRATTAMSALLADPNTTPAGFPIALVAVGLGLLVLPTLMKKSRA